jgi:hypothetical protein
MGWEGPMTNRQFTAWSYWLAESWNNPTRTDNYLMQIACEVRRVLSKRPKSVQMQHFKLKFGTTQKPKAVDPKVATMASKARWLAIVGKSKGGKTVGAKVVRKKSSGLKDPEPNSPNLPVSKQSPNGNSGTK